MMNIVTCPLKPFYSFLFSNTRETFEQEWGDNIWKPFSLLSPLPRNSVFFYYGKLYIYTYMIIVLIILLANQRYDRYTIDQSQPDYSGIVGHSDSFSLSKLITDSFFSYVSRWQQRQCFLYMRWICFRSNRPCICTFNKHGGPDFNS